LKYFNNFFLTIVVTTQKFLKTSAKTQINPCSINIFYCIIKGVNDLTHITHDLKKGIQKLEKKVLPNKKKRKPGLSFFKNLKNKKFSKERTWGIAFLSLLMVGLVAAMVLASLRADLRQQAAEDAYGGECIYWHNGSCPASYTSTPGKCLPACGSGGACCKPAVVTPTKAVTPTPAQPTPTPGPDDEVSNPDCPIYNPATNTCSGYVF
jgi:hypothetical protein